MYQRFGGFIILVRNLISPHSIHRLAGFKGQGADILPGKTGTVLSRQVALEYLDVLAGKRCLMMVVPNQASRLQAVYHGILPGQLPVKIRILVLVPPAIKPNGTYFSIIGEQLGQLIVHEFIVAVPVALRIRSSRSTSGASPRSIFAIPVDVRIVEMQTNTLLVALVRQFFQNIPLKRGSIHNIVIGKACVEHRKAIVMPGCKADILCPGRLNR